MSIEREKLIRAGLRTIPGIGSQRLRQLVAVFGSAEYAWQASAKEYAVWAELGWIARLLAERTKVDLGYLENELVRQAISLVMPEEDHYPRLLAELSDAPPLLYYRGHLSVQAEGLAIVGSRQATSYGKAAAHFLAQEAARKGLVVISGLARGIDTAAHQGALAVGGETWAFLGSGVDFIYPSENLRLVERIIENGAILSEYLPGTPPESTNFPARNRLISGCARGVLVVEAGLKSGAMITVDFALEQGREVFAVPGPIFSEASRGTHHLLRSGAKIVEGMSDISAEIPAWTETCQVEGRIDREAAEQKSTHKKSRQSQEHNFVHTELSTQHENILAVLSDVPLHIDQLALQCSLPPEVLALGLLELQLGGNIEQLPGQRYVLARMC